MKEKTTLPRPTVELLNQFDLLREKLTDTQLSDDDCDEVMGQINDLLDAYDWTNYEFIDPATGLRGVKNPVGEVLVPAAYDFFNFMGDHFTFRLSHMAAEKDGKYGIVAADGTGRVISDFHFDYLIWDPFIHLYKGFWDGVKEKFGLVTPEGEVLIPNILTRGYLPWNSFVCLEADGKFGAFDIDTRQFVLPEYDGIASEPEENVLFVKDGIEGYVIEETGEFVPKDQFENDDKYADACVFTSGY
jgi:hypothetical protein